MTRQITLIVSLFVVFTAGASAEDPVKKYERLISKADRFFEHFIYPKAVENYEKAQAEKESFDAYSSLQIANCYRLMNTPISAENWYAKLEGNEIMTDQDYTNYAQVLLENGKDEEAKRILTYLKHEEIDIERLRTMDDRGQFFRDSLAYFVSNMSINSEEADFGPAFYKDGIAFVSNRKTKKILQSTYAWDGTYFLDLYYTENSEEGLTRPEAFSDRLNTIFHEGPMAFFDDGNKVIFTRNNFNLGRTKTSVEGVNKLKLYSAERIGKKKKWSKSEPLPFNSDEYAVGHPTLTKDGKTLYFSSDMPGSIGEADIFRSDLVNGQWSTPVNLGAEINTSLDELFPYISSDNVLYFASAGHSGIGGLDIYHVDLNADKLEVVNMGYPVNTRNDDFGMILEGKKGYFASDRHGGMGSDDIYELTIYRFDLTVNLVDAETGEPLIGELIVNTPDLSETVASVKGAATTSFTTFRGRSFQLKGSVEGYVDTDMAYSTAGIPAGVDTYEVDVPMKRPDIEGEIIVVRNYGYDDQVFSVVEKLTVFNGSVEALKTKFEEDYVKLVALHELESVYFDFDRSNITPDAEGRLSMLSKILEQYPDLIVTLSGHTDVRGPKWYNERLSKRRVESTKEFLIAQGIDASRIITEFLGEQQVVEQCEQQDCSENQHQLNRRTEVRLSQK